MNKLTKKEDFVFLNDNEEELEIICKRCGKYFRTSKDNWELSGCPNCNAKSKSIVRRLNNAKDNLYAFLKLALTSKNSIYEVSKNITYDSQEYDIEVIVELHNRRTYYFIDLQLPEDYKPQSYYKTKIRDMEARKDNWKYYICIPLAEIECHPKKVYQYIISRIYENDRVPKVVGLYPFYFLSRKKKEIFCDLSNTEIKVCQPDYVKNINFENLLKTYKKFSYDLIKYKYLDIRFYVTLTYKSKIIGVIPIRYRMYCVDSFNIVICGFGVKKGYRMSNFLLKEVKNVIGKYAYHLLSSSNKDKHWIVVSDMNIGMEDFWHSRLCTLKTISNDDAIMAKVDNNIDNTFITYRKPLRRSTEIYSNFIRNYQIALNDMR